MDKIKTTNKYVSLENLSMFLENIKQRYATKVNIPSKVSELENDSGYMSSSLRGVANGVASLNEDAKIPAEQLPTYSERYSSIDEVVVGTWIDGRTIYRKTIVWESGQLNKIVTNSDGTTKKNGWSYYRGLSSLNIDQYIKVEGMSLCYSTMADETPLWQPIPRICPDACTDYSIGMGDLKSDQIGVLFGEEYTSAIIYFTIEYVKKNA